MLGIIKGVIDLAGLKKAKQRLKFAQGYTSDTIADFSYFILQYLSIIFLTSLFLNVNCPLDKNLYYLYPVHTKNSYLNKYWNVLFFICSWGSLRYFLLRVIHRFKA